MSVARRSTATKAVRSAANRIVISNVTGMNIGQLCSGRAPTSSGYDRTAATHCRK